MLSKAVVLLALDAAFPTTPRPIIPVDCGIVDVPVPVAAAALTTTDFDRKPPTWDAVTAAASAVDVPGFVEDGEGQQLLNRNKTMPGLVLLFSAVPVANVKAAAVAIGTPWDLPDAYHQHPIGRGGGFAVRDDSVQTNLRRLPWNWIGKKLQCRWSDESLQKLEYAMTDPVRADSDKS